jgi:eukaryotic-like serine/threonine-protein kinase
VAASSPAGFGKYELLERLAVGGMAELYRARFHAVAGVTKPVVIKKILPAFADSQAFVTMFVNEARIAVSLSHGNIAQVFDFGAVDGEYFLAMEYVHGQPLSRVLRRAHALQFPFLPEPIALQIAIDMCRGLHYAHTRTDEAGQPLHIIHHDVSPQNVLVGYAGEVKIVDFGIARARHATNTEMQTTGVKGKYPYFSPEQARGEAVDLRTDVYATGVVLYQMLCGRLPHKGPLVQTMQSIVRGEYPPPRSLNPGLTPALERAVMIAMAYRAEDRFATALALADALSAVLHGLGPRPPTVRDFMGFLFEPELLAEGTDVKPSRAVLELVPQWRKGGRPMSVPDSVPSNTTASVHGMPVPHGRRWAMLGVGGVALLVGVVLAATLGRSPTFDLELRSEPPGASVEVDGQAVPGATPLRIHGLGPAQAHKIRVRMPGRQDWTGEVRGLSGTTVRLQADLAEPPTPPSP